MIVQSKDILKMQEIIQLVILQCFILHSCTCRKFMQLQIQTFKALNYIIN